MERDGGTSQGGVRLAWERTGTGLDEKKITRTQLSNMNCPHGHVRAHARRPMPTPKTDGRAGGHGHVYGRGQEWPRTAATETTIATALTAAISVTTVATKTARRPRSRPGLGPRKGDTPGTGNGNGNGTTIFTCLWVGLRSVRAAYDEL